MTDTLRIRPMCADDPERIAAEERAQGWIHASAEKYETRLRDAAAGRCAALVAELGGAPVGYINVYWTPLAGPLADMPEIVDFGVLARVRRRGVGTALMDAAETLAAGRAASVCLAVGLHAGYGAAPRLCARRLRRLVSRPGVRAVRPLRERRRPRALPEQAPSRRRAPARPRCWWSACSA